MVVVVACKWKTSFLHTEVLAMKKMILGFGILFTVLNGTNSTYATLIKIGTAEYNGSNYQLIWDDDNNGKSIVWLDYHNPGTGQTWEAQKSWAAGLDVNLSYHLDPAYSVTWESAWRLGNTLDGDYVRGTDGTTTAGFNITTSEMGHLFYVELGNTAYMELPATPESHPLEYTGIFENLSGGWYWSDTEFGVNQNYAWWFGMYIGKQDIANKTTSWAGGLAVRSAQVFSTSPVPEPATIFLLGSGIAGLFAARSRRLNKNCKKAVAG